MPLRGADEVGIDNSMPYPWAKLADVEGTIFAVVQAWGYQPVEPDKKFSVALLCQLLADQFDSEGEPIPSIFAISFDAEFPTNPRRQLLDLFADPKADPVGPLTLEKVEAKNQQGWVWGLRRAPLPVGTDTSAIERILFRQEWRGAALQNYQRQQEAIAEQARKRQAPRAVAAPPSNGRMSDPPDDLPF